MHGMRALPAELPGNPTAHEGAFRDPHAPPPEEIPEALVNAILFARRASL
jgi:hypothetical protein